MSELHERDLIYDWNDTPAAEPSRRRVSVVDETLWEAVNAQSATQPALATQLEMLRSAAALHMREANLGAFSPDTAEHLEQLARAIDEERLPLAPALTVNADEAAVQAADALAQRVGRRLRLNLRVPVGEAERLEMGLSLETVAHQLTLALRAAARLGFEPRVTLHDASCARPETLRRLLGVSAHEGAKHICLGDRGGCASPSGVRHLVVFTRGVLDELGSAARLGWFGRNDRDLALANALEAHQNGVEMLHGTALGLGRGAGCVPVDLLLANLLLLGAIDADLSALKRYCDLAASALGVTIAVNYPIVGADAFRTATGVHAAAIIKARRKGDHWLADRVYSSVPAGLFGLTQIIDVGPMSGESNAAAWLEHHGIEPRPEVVKHVIARAKQSTHTLTADEILEAVGELAGRASGEAR
ncbi:MAG: hypothetical protein EB084_04640 [Proteobacteria bacterium]|nr:hypothetical protein [Pseudomonadota bacterium]